MALVMGVGDKCEDPAEGLEDVTWPGLVYLTEHS